MKIGKLQDMKGGWFIGNFEPSLLKTNDCEVAVKSYKKGDYEEPHYHKIATEYTAIITGRVKMNGVEYCAGDIIVMEPDEDTDFESLEDGTANVVVKIPGANNDKYKGRTLQKEMEKNKK
jgi:quercetin dioxygenase-like cupin family protein